METFLDRLIAEQKELEEKIDKLDSFINSDNFKKVEAVQGSLLVIQLNAMLTYDLCLIERINWLNIKEECSKLPK